MRSIMTAFAFLKWRSLSLIISSYCKVLACPYKLGSVFRRMKCTKWFFIARCQVIFESVFKTKPCLAGSWYILAVVTCQLFSKALMFALDTADTFFQWNRQIWDRVRNPRFRYSKISSSKVFYPTEWRLLFFLLYLWFQFLEVSW